MQEAQETNADKLVTKQQLLAVVFDEASRPSLRWLNYQIAARIIPYYKIGGRIFFSPTKVRETLEKRNMIAPH